MYLYYFRIADIEIEFASENPVSWPDNMLPFFVRQEKFGLYGIESETAENEIVKGEITKVETVKNKIVERNADKVRCFLCIQDRDRESWMDQTEYPEDCADGISGMKNDRGSHRKLLKTVPFGRFQENHEIRFYCIKHKKIYLAEYPSVLLQEGVLFRSDNISGYLGLEFMLMDYGCFWLHASCISWQGNGIVFSAPSGTGKSTQAVLWERLEDAEILNGDRILIRNFQNNSTEQFICAENIDSTDDMRGDLCAEEEPNHGSLGRIEYRVYGSPFAGSSHIYKQKKENLTAIFLLKQFPVNEVKILSSAQNFLRIYGEALHCPENMEYTRQLQNMVKTLVLQVPVMELRCTPDMEAVNLAKTIIIHRIWKL